MVADFAHLHYLWHWYSRYYFQNPSSHNQSADWVSKIHLFYAISRITIFTTVYTKIFLQLCQKKNPHHGQKYHSSQMTPTDLPKMIRGSNHDRLFLQYHQKHQNRYSSIPLGNKDMEVKSVRRKIADFKIFGIHRKVS